MGALDKLKNLVHESFKEMNDTESVKKLALIENEIQNVEKEIDEKDKETNQLCKDYKELLMKQGSKEEPKADIPTGKEVSFDSLLNEAIKNDKKNKEEK